MYCVSAQYETARHVTRPARALLTLCLDATFRRAVGEWFCGTSRFRGSWADVPGFIAWSPSCRWITARRRSYTTRTRRGRQGAQRPVPPFMAGAPHPWRLAERSSLRIGHDFTFPRRLRRSRDLTGNLCSSRGFVADCGMSSGCIGCCHVGSAWPVPLTRPAGFVSLAAKCGDLRSFSLPRGALRRMALTVASPKLLPNFRKPSTQRQSGGGRLPCAVNTPAGCTPLPPSRRSSFSCTARVRPKQGAHKPLGCCQMAGPPHPLAQRRGSGQSAPCRPPAGRPHLSHLRFRAIIVGPSGVSIGLAGRR